MRGGLLPVIVAGLTPVLLLTLIITGLGLGLVLWHPSSMWTSQFGTAETDHEGVDNAVTGVSADSNGAYATGYVGVPRLVYFKPQPSDLFLNRYDSNGRQVWSRHFGNATRDRIEGIGTAMDGVYLTGFVNGTSVLLRYNISGDLIWSHIYEGRQAVDYGVAVGDTGIYTASLDDLNESILVREYDFLGNPVWSNMFGNSSSSIGSVAGISVVSNGVYVAGKSMLTGNGSTVPSPTDFIRKYDLQGREQWTRGLNASAAGLSSDSGGLYVLAFAYPIYPTYPTAPADALVRKYDFNGNILWTVRISPPDYTSFRQTSLSVERSEVYLATTTGTGNAFIWKYDGSGKNMWFFQKGAPHSAALDLHISAGGTGLYVGGNVWSASGSDAFVTEFSQSSSLIFIGVNPPLSFLILGAAVGGAALSIVWLRKYRKNRPHPANANPMRYGSTKPSN